VLPPRRAVSEAYANYECLGWYSSGTNITPYDYTLHTQVRATHNKCRLLGVSGFPADLSVLPVVSCPRRQFKKYNERPLFVLLNPSQAGPGMRDLPLTVYEEAIHVVNDQTTSEFVKTAYVVQADEAERITVTYCAKVVNQEESGSEGQTNERATERTLSGGPLSLC
jgi:hypothetical protein